MMNTAKQLIAEVETERVQREAAERKCIKYVNMSRTYWERWRWELGKRRELMVNERLARSRRQDSKVILRQIDPSMLKDPIINGEREEYYVGRGSFGIVRLQVFRDIQVAVKEFLPHSLQEDVTHEAYILNSLSSLSTLFIWCVSN